MTDSIPFQLIDSNGNIATALKAEWRLLEASAGTGKTYTLAGLFIRMLLEQEHIHCRSILVITFTRAATAELRTRIHQLLHESIAVLQEDAAASDNPFVQWVAERFSDDPIYLRRLQRAYLELDQTPIQTIHSFCQSLLQQFAFSTQRSFELDIINEHKEIDLEIAADFWRRHLFTDHVSTSSIIMACKNISLEQLLRLAQHCQRYNCYQLEGSQADAAPQQVLNDIHSQFTEMCTHWPTARQQILTLAEEEKSFHATSAYGPKKLAQTLADTDALIQHGLLADSKLIESQTDDYLTKKVLKKYKEQIPDSPYFSHAGELFQLMEKLEHSIHQSFIEFYRDEIDSRLEQQVLGSHDDIVRWLDRALQDHKQLGASIGAQFNAAFIDECQDTDFAQYRIIRNVFCAEQHVYLIGDPKQSIYRFRGADIFSYLAARQHVQQHYVLDTNYRSDQTTIHGFNFLFEQIPHVFQIAGIDYQSVHAHNPDRLLLAEQHASGVICWDCENEEGTLSDEQRALAIANEIRELCDNGKIADKPVFAQDIAILVASHREGQLIAQTLEAQHIPVVQSGGQNIYASEEALNLLHLLNACCKRHQRSALANALASPLCRYNNAELRLEIDAEFAESKRFFHQLMDVWQQHGLLAMFQFFLASEHLQNQNSTQQHTQQNTQQSIRASILNSPRGERALVNYGHLVELLHCHANEQQAGPLQVLQHLEQNCADSNKRHEDLEIRLSTDEAAVTVLTIHKSKGLEFPIVFIPHANKQKKISHGFFIDYHKQTEDEHGMRTWNYTQAYADKNNKIEAEPELRSEQLRLFYVAVTRAKHRCYIGIDKIDGQCLGLLSGIKDNSYAHYHSLCQSDDCALSWQTANPQPFQTSAPDPSEDTPVHDIPPALQLLRSWSLSSYSGLIRQIDHSVKDHDHHISPQLHQSAFPKGPKAGNCLHALFENIPFDQIENETRVDEIIKTQLALNDFDQQYADAAKQLVKDTLASTPPQLSIPLAALSPEAYIPELEFFSSQPALSAHDLVDCLKEESTPALQSYFDRLSDVHIPKGYLRGFIDLIFHADGQWHILDWKSNVLDTYDHERMHQEMCSHDYIFQYHIYTLALHRFLRLRLPDYDYDTHIGKIYYAFIRGIQADTDEHTLHKTDGWYVERPSAQLIQRLDRLLQEPAHA